MDEHRSGSDVPVSVGEYKPANNREQLLEWLKEIVPFSILEKYVREKDYTEVGRFGFAFCTAEYTYSISGGESAKDTETPGYLGCIATSRRALAGESWMRGSDLPDGEFSRAIWEKIKTAIVRYEVVKMAPLHVGTCAVVGGPAVVDLDQFKTHTFYGPHGCEDCGQLIVRQDRLKGGVTFDSLGLGYDIYPSNRPDLPWKLHQCGKPSPVQPLSAGTNVDRYAEAERFIASVKQSRT